MTIKKNYSHAWLIGGGGGIGRELLKVVHKHSLISVSCDVKSNSKTAKNIIYFCLDCSDKTQLNDFAEKTVKKYGPPDLLVIAAGLVISKKLEDCRGEEVFDIYKNNFELVVSMLQKFFESCNKDRNIFKNVIIISSNASLEPRPNQPVYAAMKSAINSLAQSQAASWGDKNIKINVIAPGTVAVERNISSLKKKYRNFPHDPSRPSGKILLPKDLFPLFELLLNRDLSITGEIIRVDGGSNLV